MINEGLTIKGKPLKDHLEAKGHTEALDLFREPSRGSDHANKLNFRHFPARNRCFSGLKVPFCLQEGHCKEFEAPSERLYRWLMLQNTSGHDLRVFP